MWYNEYEGRLWYNGYTYNGHVWAAHQKSTHASVPGREILRTHWCRLYPEWWSRAGLSSVTFSLWRLGNWPLGSADFYRFIHSLPGLSRHIWTGPKIGCCPKFAEGVQFHSVVTLRLHRCWWDVGRLLMDASRVISSHNPSQSYNTRRYLEMRASISSGGQPHNYWKVHHFCMLLLSFTQDFEAFGDGYPQNILILGHEI